MTSEGATQITEATKVVCKACIFSVVQVDTTYDETPKYWRINKLPNIREV